MRTGIVFPGAEGRQRHVGQIRTKITLRNNSDVDRALRGEISAAEVRELTIEDVLVDTGANQLALPARMIESLGLREIREVDVETAAGFHKARVFGYVELTVGPRSHPFECLELPGGETALLGVNPLELLGIELDIQKQRIIILPDRGRDTYLTAL